MPVDQEQRSRASRDGAAAVFGWLSVGFAALFFLALVVFATGIMDLREGGEAGFAAVIFALAPALFFGSVWLVVRVFTKAETKPPTTPFSG